MVDRYYVESVVEDIVKKYGLNPKPDHLQRVIGEILRMEVPPEKIRLVAISQLDVGESYFFRDRETWHALPHVLSGMNTVRFLSIGCSEGEEVYSFSFIASVITKATEIKGIDACDERIRKAKEGIYEEWKLRTLSEHEKSRYFERVGGKKELFKVKDEYRKGVTFETSNILDVEIPPGYDLVFIRRVLMYLDEAATKDVLDKVRRALKDDGFLVLGKGEVYWEVLEDFEPIPIGKAVFWRKKKRRESTGAMERVMAEIAIQTPSEIEKFEIIKSMINNGMYEEALEWSRYHRKLNPGEPEAWKYEILALTYLGREEEAASVLEKARELFPHDRDLRRLEGIIR